MPKLLVPIDGSATSERQARQLLHWQQLGWSFEVELLNVQIPAVSGHGRNFVNPQDLEDYYREQSNEALAPARAILDAAGIAHKDYLAVGHPGTTIADLAAQHGVDGIMMGTHGRTALASVVLGSVTQEVVHKATVPVILVK